MDDVVQIFIRMNDGGTPLSHSDLLLSIAVAQWTTHDAREEIHELVDALNRIGLGFSFSKDFVLKAGLMLSDIGSVGFKVDNFNRENMAILEERWMSIRSTLTLTVQLVAGFGFSRATLTAHNAILAIAYYLYRSKRTESFLSHNRHEEDRRRIRGWLIRSLLKSGVWGSGLDTLLTALRKVIREDGTHRCKHSVMGAGGDARGVDMEVAGRGAIQRAQVGTVRQAWEAGRLAERSPGGVQGRGYARRRARGGRVWPSSTARQSRCKGYTYTALGVLAGTPPWAPRAWVCPR